MDDQWEPRALWPAALPVHLGTVGVYTCEATNPASGSRSATDTLIIIPGEWVSLEGTLVDQMELEEPWETTHANRRPSTEKEEIWWEGIQEFSRSQRKLLDETTELYPKPLSF